MSGPTWSDQGFLSLASWWQALGYDIHFGLWSGFGLLALVLWSWLGYVVLRRLAGHRKYQGRWYDEAEYARLMQVLWDDQQAGTRVMSRSELTALREFRYGPTAKPILKGKGGGYFDV